MSEERAVIYVTTGLHTTRIVRSNKPYVVVDKNTLIVLNSDDKSLIGKEWKLYMFEVKTTLDDRWIGQCLRYLTAYPFFGEITLITPKGFADGWLKVVSKFKLPINIIQLAVSGVTKPNLLPRPHQPPRLLNFPEMPKTVKGLRQLWKERARIREREKNHRIIQK